jgi:transcriptional regulator with XRE-family HTH domain
MEERDVTAAKLSKGTGIPKSTISEWLQGRQPKFDDAVLRLAKFLKVSPETLLTGEIVKIAESEKLLSITDDGFVEIHDGIFRLKIEKYIGKKK